MIVRLSLASALAAGLALSASGTEAAPTPVLDGKKIKTISFTAVAPVMANDATTTLNDLDEVDRTACTPDLCAYRDFIFKPAKGVKAISLAFESTWAAPAPVDIDLYIGAVDKYGDSSTIAQCAAGVGNRERVYLTANNFKPGRKYRMVAYFYRTFGDTVTTKVTFNGTNQIPKTAPSDVDGFYPVNCGL